jgi:hypothetical protein
MKSKTLEPTSNRNLQTRTPPSLNGRNTTAKPPPFQLPGVPLLQNAWYHDPYAYLVLTVKKRTTGRKKGNKKGKKKKQGAGGGVQKKNCCTMRDAVPYVL